MSKKQKQTKTEQREARLRKARQWALTYEGSHIVRAYRKRFKVDYSCALNDLEAIGALGPEKLAFHDRYPDSDDTFFFIAGYTSGGAPYGVTWAEMGLAPWQDPDDTV